MTVRTNETTITFEHPFLMPSIGRVQPPGTYRLVTDEEEMIGLSFIAFRRMATTLHVPAISAPDTIHQVFAIEPAELEAALKRDGGLNG